VATVNRIFSCGYIRHGTALPGHSIPGAPRGGENRAIEYIVSGAKIGKHRVKGKIRMGEWKKKKRRKRV
jgi:hypothetical protein